MQMQQCTEWLSWCKWSDPVDRAMTNPLADYSQAAEPAAKMARSQYSPDIHTLTKQPIRPQLTLIQKQIQIQTVPENSHLNQASC